MKIIPNTIQTNFQGYKNIISGGIHEPQYILMFLSAELNNEDGYCDLAEYKKFMQMASQYKNNDPNICSLVYAQNDSREILFMNEDLIYGCEGLQQLQTTSSKMHYSEIEAAMMKAHTLIASITRRLSQNGMCAKDANITTVIHSTIDTLSKILKNKENAHKFFTLSMVGKPRNEKWAFLINDYISRTMTAFFK